MKGSDIVPDKLELSDAKRALLEKYLREGRPRTKEATGGSIQRNKAEVADPREQVVTIQDGGSKRPFFFLQGDWIFGAYWCFPLARGLGSDQPFYTLEPYRFNDLGVLPLFEAIAAAHIESLRAVQPEGPYMLGGFCNGGLVAYEMARQLYAQGERVELLVLMDPMGLVYPARDRLISSVVNRLGGLLSLGQDKRLYYFLWLHHVYRYLQHIYRYLRFPHYRRLKTELDPQRVNACGGTILTLKTLYELKLGQDAAGLKAEEQIGPGFKGERVGFALPKLDSIFPDPIFPTAEAMSKDYPAIYDWVAMHFKPSSLYPGKITFFWDSEEWDNEKPFRRARWRKVAEANEVDVHVIAGTQSSCRTVHLHVLAEHLSACLNKVQAAKSG